MASAAKVISFGQEQEFMGLVASGELQVADGAVFRRCRDGSRRVRLIKLGKRWGRFIESEAAAA